MKIKVTSFFSENMKKNLKNRIALIALAGVLTFNLVGCGQGYVEGQNKQSFEYTQEDTSVYAVQTPFSDEDLRNLPSSIESIHLNYALYLSDLDDLPEICPNLRRLTLDNCPSIEDISFIYRLHNLEYLSLNDCAYITPELVEYLDSMGIEHNITQSDLEAAQKVDDIISEIITDDMTDEEKIQAVTYYVIDNYKYRITKVSESNSEPLESMFVNKGGVCASYAYLTNILLRKAGITSYEIVSDSHAWNLLELDGKYYYVDATNIKQPLFPAKFLLKHFNVGLCYMTDPNANTWAVTEDYNDLEKVIIPQSLIEDIERGESEKNLWEKYGNSIPARIIEILVIMVAIGKGFSLASTAVDNIRYSSYSRRGRRR